MYRVLGYWTVYCTQSGGVHNFLKHKSNMYTFVQPRGGCLYFPLKHKSAMYTFVHQRGGGSRRDPNHKSMYKCAYMYVHLSLSPPPPPPPCQLVTSENHMKLGPLIPEVNILCVELQDNWYFLFQEYEFSLREHYPHFYKGMVCLTIK